MDATTDSVEARVAEQLAAINRLEAAVASAGAPETSTVGVGLKDKLYDFTSARLLEILASLNRADPVAYFFHLALIGVNAEVAG